MHKRPEFWIYAVVVVGVPFYMSGFSGAFALGVICAAGLWGVTWQMRH